MKKNSLYVCDFSYDPPYNREGIRERNSSGDKLYILDENKKCSVNFVQGRYIYLFIFPTFVQVSLTFSIIRTS